MSIPPIVSPGTTFQRLVLPNFSGVAGNALRVSSVDGVLASLEWFAPVDTNDPRLLTDGDKGDIVVSDSGATWTVSRVSPLRPVIVTPPDDASVDVGQTATFTVTAATIANTHLVLTYQWQLSTDGGTTWVNIIGATANNYTTPASEIGWDDYRFRCLVSNQLGTEITKVAILAVNAVSYTPSLNFSDFRNSMYIALLIEEF